MTCLFSLFLKKKKNLTIKIQCNIFTKLISETQYCRKITTKYAAIFQQFYKKIRDYDSHETKKRRMQMDSEKSRTFRNRGKLYVYANLGCCLLR